MSVKASTPLGGMARQIYAAHSIAGHGPEDFSSVIKMLQKRAEAMALHHAQPGVPVPVQPFGASLQGQKTSALFKSETLEVIRLVLMAGKRLPVHQVPGEMTLQCLEGQLTLSQNGNHQTLSAGQLLFLPAQTRMRSRPCRTRRP